MELPPITLPMVTTLAIAAGALILFVWNRLPFEVVGLLVMVSLAVSRVLRPEDAISGFSDTATLTVAAILFLSLGLERTGVVAQLGRWISRLTTGGERRLQAVLMGTTVTSSAFFNNTAVVAMLLPVAQELGRRQKVPPSRLLMPLSFASQLGGTTTLVGTSTNLLVAGLIVDFGLPELGIFDITLPALILAAAGLIYLLTFGRLLLPSRDSGEERGTIVTRAFQTALLIEEGSPFVGSTVEELEFPGREDLKIFDIRRKETNESLSKQDPLKAGDVLHVEGSSEALGLANEVEGLCIPGAGRQESGRERPVLLEAVIPPRSNLVGRRVRTAGPLAWHGAVVLAVQRRGAPVDEMGRNTLESGDLLLIESTRSSLRRIQRAGLLIFTAAVELRPYREEKGLVAAAIFIGVILAAALGLAPIIVSAMVGVVLMFLTRCITPREAYEQMDWAVLILLGTLIPLGIAMQATGAADLVAALALGATGGFGLTIVLGAVYLLTSILTEFISNNASAVMLTPVAIAVASTLGVSPMPFVIAVMFAASNSFMTPVGYQTNTFVFGPGQYRFTDFLRVGGPLSLLLLLLAVFVIPAFFPF